MTKYDLISEAVTRYARNYVRARREMGVTWNQIAFELQCSRPYVQQIADVDAHPAIRIGPQVELGLAERIHGGSVDALRRAALAVYGGAEAFAAEVDGSVLRLTNGAQPDATAPSSDDGASSDGGSSHPPPSPAAGSGFDSGRRIRRARVRNPPR